MPILVAQLASFWLICIWYGNGLDSVVVMGGMWSLCVLTYVTIFITVASSVDSVAFRTLARSARLVSGPNRHHR